MSMTLATHLFEGQDEYKKLHKVFCESAMHTMPGVIIKTVTTKQPDLTEEQKEKWRNVHHYGTAKAFIDLSEYILELNEPVVVCDVDLMFLRSIGDFWEKYPKVDLAFTQREYKHPLNTGIWFYRPTKESKTFVKQWIKNTKAVRKAFAKGNRKQVNLESGIDQAALRMTMEQMPKVATAMIPCLEWNATQSEWHIVTEKTRVIHIKSHLRDVILGHKELAEGKECLVPFIRKWRQYYEINS